jgi:diketogulonate reductase-like aldo/keto reductase
MDAAADRYQLLPYARCGLSGPKLPRISLGLWQNFGTSSCFENARDTILKSFDHGITHFDLANSWAQIQDSLGALQNGAFTSAELAQIDAHASDGGLNIWATSSQSG